MAVFLNGVGNISDVIRMMVANAADTPNLPINANTMVNHDNAERYIHYKTIPKTFPQKSDIEHSFHKRVLAIYYHQNNLVDWH